MLAWQPLGTPPPRELADARLQAHWAAQLAAAPGQTLLEPRPDDSHPNLGWDPRAAALVGHATPAPGPCRAGLRVADLTLLLLDADGGPLDTLCLEGRTLAEASAWLAAAVARRRGSPLATPLARPPYELAPHPVADGRAFRAERPALAELARWFANADRLLRGLVAAECDAAPVRCWPHHFDLATLLALGQAPDGTPATIGVGLSPGDEFYPEPYWYVSPYPHPEEPSLPPLAGGGSWHTEGFVSAILTGTHLVAAGAEAAAQEERARAFVASALAAGHALVAAARAEGSEA